jgi:hypothetical protein
VLTSMRTTSKAATSEAPTTGTRLHGVYLGVDMRTVTGRGGRATMEPHLVWYRFSSDGWFDWRWGPWPAHAIQHDDESMPYSIANGQLEYTSPRGGTYQRDFKRLGKDAIQLGSVKLTRVDKGYDKLALHGTYRAETAKYVANVADRSGATGSYGSSDTTLTFTKDGKVSEQRATAVSTDVTGETRGGSNQSAREGTYAIAANAITFRWSDGSSETRTFAIWDGSMTNPTTLVLDNAVYQR